MEILHNDGYKDGVQGNQPRHCDLHWVQHRSVPSRLVPTKIQTHNTVTTWSVATTKYIYVHQTIVTLVAGGPDGTFVTGLGAGKTQQRCVVRSWLYVLANRFYVSHAELVLRKILFCEISGKCFVV